MPCSVCLAASFPPGSPPLGLTNSSPHLVSTTSVSTCLGLTYPHHLPPQCLAPPPGSPPLPRCISCLGLTRLGLTTTWVSCLDSPPPVPALDSLLPPATGLPWCLAWVPRTWVPPPGATAWLLTLGLHCLGLTCLVLTTAGVSTAWSSPWVSLPPGFSTLGAPCHLSATWASHTWFHTPGRHHLTSTTWVSTTSSPAASDSAWVSLPEFSHTWVSHHLGARLGATTGCHTLVPAWCSHTGLHLPGLLPPGSHLAWVITAWCHCWVPLSATLGATSGCHHALGATC
ncbi:hypothetical protein GPJ56_007208 [Histomonas meleagridis]|nr:hypothetical protein GPJ56_007208 [Histomonas meleagridis]